MLIHIVKNPQFVKIWEHPFFPQYGIAGCIIVPVNEALVRTLFILLLLEFRTKAPGAKTVAQFVRQRIGIYLATNIYTFTVNVGGTWGYEF